MRTKEKRLVFLMGYEQASLVGHWNIHIPAQEADQLHHSSSTSVTSDGNVSSTSFPVVNG
jgi:hypothetical protein